MAKKKSSKSKSRGTKKGSSSPSIADATTYVADQPPAVAPPKIRQCGAMAAHFRLLEADPGFRSRQLNLENAVARRMLTGMVALTGGPTTIPVVVHVVF